MENNYKEVSSMRDPRLLLRLTGRAIALLALFVVFAAGTANAQPVCHVDTGGDDNLDGQTPATANRTIAGCLAEGYVTDGTIISVEAGTYNEAHVTISEDLIFEGRQTGSFTRVIVENGFTIDADVTIRANSQGGGDAVYRLGDTNLTMALVLDDGSLTVTNSVDDGRVRIPSGGRVTRDDDTSVSGEITYLGTANVFYTDNNGSDTNVTAGGELPSNFSDGTLNVNLGGGNTLTLTSVTDLDNLVSAAGSVINGEIIIAENITITGPGNVGTLTVNSGTVTIASSAAVQSVNIANNDGITFALGGFTLTINGDFTRQGGTFTTAAGGRFDFVGANTDNTFSPGPNFAISTVTIDKNGQTLTITEDIDVTNTGGLAFMVATGSTASFTDDQINVTSSGIVDIDGMVDNESLIVFRAAAADLQGDGLYGDILVATGGGDVTVGATSQEDVRFTGELNLTSGGITVGGDDDISPSGTGASIVVNAARADTDIAGTFNADNVDYDLEYVGNIGGGTKVAGSEFEADDIRDLTFNTQNGTVDAVTNGTPGTISGNVALNDVGAAYTVNFPTPITVQGSLTVEDDATLNGTALTLQGASNSVLGTISAATTTTLDGTLTLSGTADDDFPSTVGPLVVNNGETVTVTNIQRVVGSLTVNTDGNLFIGLADEQDVTGNIVSNGDSVTLTSDVDAGADVTINSGVLAFGGNDLMVAGNFTGAANVDYTSSGGALDLDAANKTFSINGETIPNVIVSGVTATMMSNATISNSLVETGAGVLDVNGNTLNLMGSVTSNGSTFIDDAAAPAGLVDIVSTTMTLSGDATIDARILVDDNTLTVASNNNDPRTLTAGRNVELEGDLHLGINSFVVMGDNTLTFDGGAVTSSSGELVLADANVDFANNNNGTVDRLAVTTADAVIGPASNGTLTVENRLRLDDDIVESNPNNDHLALASGVLIVVNVADPLDNADPAFAGPVSITYNVPATSGQEMPDNGQLIDLTINAATTVDQDASVSGVLTLNGVLNTSSANEIITLGDGARLVLMVDNANVPANRLAGSEYILEFAGPSDTITDIEFLAGANVTTLVINPTAGNTITNSLTGANDTRTVNNIDLQRGTFELAGTAFNIGGDLSFSGGNLVNTGGLTALSFTGASDGTIMLAGDYVVNNINVTMDKSSDAVVTLTGPENATATLDFFTSVERLFLNGGILDTEENTDIWLYQDATTQGFMRTVSTGEESHVAGNVTKRLESGDPFGTFVNGNGATVNKSARFEYPAGDTLGNYRPLALTFRNPVVSQTDITINNESMNPEGELGLPVTDDAGITIGNYPDFFWLIESSISLGQNQLFDVELTATDIGFPITNEDSLRIIKRFDGNAEQNEWSIQGMAENYDNFLSVTNGDTTVIARVVNSQGGIVPQGARFTLGLPTRAPMFLTRPQGDSLQVDEGEVVNFTFTADPRDLGESVTFGLENEPDFVTIDAQAGLLTAAPDTEDAGTYTFNVLAEDESDTTRLALTLVVRDVISITPAEADTTISDGQTLTIDFDASNPDPNDPVTWSLAETVENAAIDAETGVFTFTPDFEQAGADYTFTVSAENASDSAGVSFVVSVTADFLLGDVNDSGAMTLTDVSVTLDAVIGASTLDAKGEMAADVSGTAGVSAFDAALMLQCLAAEGPTVEDTAVCDFPAEGAGKTQAIVASADLEWGAGESAEGGVAIPVTLTGNVANVYSVEVTADMDMTATTLKSVTGSMPDGWQIAWTANKETGKIRVAMFGATPINYGGEVARLIFSLDENTTSVNLQAEAFVNENPAVQLGSTSVMEIPTEFALGDNYPNPFNPTTTFTYSLPEASHVTIEIYDVSGRLVQTLVNGEKEAGRYEVKWDGRSASGSSVASGVYLYRIDAQSFTQVKTMMLVK